MAIQYLQIGLEEDTLLGDVSPVNVRMEQLIPENHEFLMQFIDYDLSKAEQPLAEYLTCLDTGKDAKKQLLISAITELQQMHPYFHFCRENAAWLLNRIFAGYIKRKFSKMDDQEQKDLFLKVAVTDYSIYADPDNIFDYSLDAGEEHILDHLYNLQSDIAEWVFLTIDNTNPVLAGLSAKRRSMLYAHVACKGIYNPELSLTTDYATAPSPRMRKEIAQWEFSNLDGSEGDHFTLLYRELDQLRKKPDGAIPASLQEIIDATSDASDDCNTITYTLSGFSNLLELEVFQMVHSDIRMKRCKNCGKYFIVDKSNQEYCSRLAPGSSKLCTEIGRIRVYGRKMTGDTSASGLYRKSYKTHYARVQRGQMSEDAFEIWKIHAQKKRDQAKAGELDMYDYEEWLKQ